jgi:hypothetical protein
VTCESIVSDEGAEEELLEEIVSWRDVSFPAAVGAVLV